jgi:hypothetical protein
MSAVVLKVVLFGVILLNVMAPQIKHVIHVILPSVIALSGVILNDILLGAILLSEAPPQIENTIHVFLLSGIVLSVVVLNVVLLGVILLNVAAPQINLKPCGPFFCHECESFFLSSFKGNC